MANILKLKRHSAKKEIEFELKFLKSLSVKKRFEMMFKKTREIINLLEKSGHRRPIVNFASLNDLIKMKRAAARSKDLDDLKYLIRLKKQKKE